MMRIVIFTMMGMIKPVPADGVNDADDKYDDGDNDEYDNYDHLSFDCVATNGVPAENPVEVRQTLFLLVHREYYHVNNHDNHDDNQICLSFTVHCKSG